MPNWSVTDQCSTTLPPSSRLMWISLHDAGLPVAGRPKSGPRTRAVAGDPLDHLVPIRHRVLDVIAQVREGGAKQADQLLQPLEAGRDAGWKKSCSVYPAA